MDIASTIVDLLRQRAPGASICPSDVARALASDEPAWRALMPSIRDTAAALARSECIAITQGADRVDPADVDHGPIRLRRGPMFPPAQLRDRKKNQVRPRTLFWSRKLNVPA